MTNPRFNSTHSALVSDRRMWLGHDIAAIEARVTLYHVEGTQDTYEVYICVGGEVPRRFVGKLGECLNIGQAFVDARAAEGYIAQLPSFNESRIS